MDAENLIPIAYSDAKEIKSFAFAGNNKLKSINFPNVEKINEGAFEGCINLASVTLGIEPPELGKNVFGYENVLVRRIVFHIPHNANLVAYKIFFNNLEIDVNNANKVKIGTPTLPL